MSLRCIMGNVGSRFLKKKKNMWNIKGVIWFCCESDSVRGTQRQNLEPMLPTMQLFLYQITCSFLWTHSHVVKSCFCYWVLSCSVFEVVRVSSCRLRLFWLCGNVLLTHAVTTASVFCLFRNRKSLQALKDTLLLSDRNDWMTRRARRHPPSPPCLHVPPLPPPPQGSPGWWWFRSPLSLPKFGMIGSNSVFEQIDLVWGFILAFYETNNHKPDLLRVLQPLGCAVD